jgi:hypothetical protein
MAMADNLLFLDDARQGADEHAAAPGLAEAAELVAALSALIDAGLVVVHEGADGAARYGTRDGPEDAA